MTDVNGDGIADIATHTRYVVDNPAMCLLLGNGDGSFRPSTTFSSASKRSTAFALADVNGDGAPDLAVSELGAALSVRINNSVFGSEDYQIDRTAPTITLVASPPPINTSASAVFSFTGNDPRINGVAAGVSRLEYRLDSGAFAPAISPVSFNNLTEGAHKFEVRAIDNVGNISLPTSYSWTNDFHTPFTTIDAKPPLVTNDTSATFRFSTSIPIDGVAGQEYRLDGNAFSAATSPLLLTNLAEGTHTFQVRGVSGRGMAGPVAVYSWNIDRTGPTVQLFPGPSPVTTVQTAAFTMNAIDPVSAGVSSGVATIESRIDNGPFVVGAGPVNFTNLGLGKHTFEARATDTVGNTGAIASYSWTIVDGIAPRVVSINRSLPAAPFTNGDSVAYTVTFSEAVTGVDAGDFVVVTTGAILSTPPIIVTGSGNTYTVAVNGISGEGTLGLNLVDNGTIRDLANNPLASETGQSSNFVGQTFSFDRTNPTATLAGQPATITNSASATFSFTGADPSAGGVSSGVNRFDYQIDNGTFATATSPFSLNGLSEGTHTFRVRAVDNVGNFGTATSYSWAIDLTAPVVIFTTPPPQVTFNLAALSFAATDAVNSGVVSGVNRLEYRLDGGAFQTAISPLNFANLANGSHTVALRAIDNAGNVSSLVSATWLVDIVPASVQSINRLNPTSTPPNAANVTYQVTFNKSVTGVDPGDFAVALFGTTASPAVTVTAVSGSVYNVTVTNIAGAGTVSLILVDNGSIRDSVGFPMAPANSSALFQAQQTYATGAVPKGTTLADVNGDGNLDLLVAYSSGNSVGVSLGNGNGTFQSLVAFDADGRPEAIAVGDVNGDGKPDLVVGNSNTSHAVNVLLGNGNGAFQAPIAFAAGSSPYSVAVGDLNGDGKADIVAANKIDGTVSVLLGNGSGAFQSQLTFAAGATPMNLAKGDVNGDGKQDLLVVNATGNTASVLLGNGNGTFQSGLTFATGLNPSALALGDVDVDGKLDLAVANADGNSVSLLLGNGNGTFQPQRVFASGNTPIGIVLANLNGDRKPDLAVVAFNGQLGVLLGNGDGGFQTQTTFATGAGPVAIAAGDVSGDGRTDVAIANAFDNSAGVYVNAITGSFLGPTFVVDRLAPIATISTNPPVLTNIASASFSFAATDPVSGGISSGVNHIEFQLDGGGFTTATSPRNLGGLSQGSHTFEGRGVDNLGNTGIAASYRWTIDTTGPIATITAQPPAQSSSSSATFSFTATDPIAAGVSSGVNRLEYRLDGGIITAATSPLVLSGLAAGSHTFSVRAVDNAGNTGAAASYSWTIAVALPQVTSVTPNGNLPSLAGPQRSRVASIVVVFDRPVQLDANAITLALHTNTVTLGGVAQPGGAGVLPTSLAAASTDNISWIVTFIGNTDDGADGIKSLRDGVYDLSVNASQVHPLGNAGLSMVASSMTTFHRLFGDTAGPTTPSGGTANVDFQAVVNTGDNLAFRGAFNNPSTYQAYLDINGDGVINSGDNLQFRNRFNKSLTWRA